MEEIYGQDILLDSDNQALVAANGEAVVSDGIQTVLQDIKLRLFTPLGELFYDREFGSRIHEFVKDENTPATRMALVAEVARRIGLEPRVQLGTVRCRLLKWDPEGVVLRADFYLIAVDHPFNLVIEIDESKALVIKDVNPR